MGALDFLAGQWLPLPTLVPGLGPPLSPHPSPSALLARRTGGFRLPGPLLLSTWLRLRVGDRLGAAGPTRRRTSQRMGTTGKEVRTGNWDFGSCLLSAQEGGLPLKQRLCLLPGRRHPGSLSPALPERPALDPAPSPAPGSWSSHFPFLPPASPSPWLYVSQVHPGPRPP